MMYYLIFAAGMFCGFVMALSHGRDPEALPLPQPELKPAPKPEPLPRSRVYWPYEQSSRN